MDVDEARNLYLEGARAAGDLFGKREGERWWPDGAVQGSAVSVGMALAWTRRIPAVECPKYLCLNLDPLPGTRRVDEATPKCRLVRRAQAADPELTYVPGEAMLDLAVLPSHAALHTGPSEFALLTMESEMCSSQNVGPVATRRGPTTYAWDLAKLLWAPCARRLFVARVGKAVDRDGEPARTGSERRADLRESVNKLVGCYRGMLRDNDVLVAVVLPKAGREYEDAMVRIYAPGSTGSPWTKLFA